MTTHEGHDHPNTKAGRAACRRAALKGEAPKTAEQGSRDRHPAGKATKAKAPRRKITEPINTSLPHTYEEDMEKADRCFVCGLTQRARVHDEVPAESRLHVAQKKCEHPADKWILKGATKKKSGHYYCTCGKYMGDEGPADLRNLLNFGKGL